MLRAPDAAPVTFHAVDTDRALHQALVAGGTVVRHLSPRKWVAMMGSCLPAPRAALQRYCDRHLLPVAPAPVATWSPGWAEVVSGQAASERAPPCPPGDHACESEVYDRKYREWQQVLAAGAAAVTAGFVLSFLVGTG